MQVRQSVGSSCCPSGHGRSHHSLPTSAMRSGHLQRTVIGSGRRLASNATRPLTGLRYSSTEHGHEHHEHNAEDATEYPQEGWARLEMYCFPADFSPIAGFATSTIVKAIAFAGAVVAFYKYAPSSSDDNIISRYISSNTTPSEVWERTNIKHTVLEQQHADESQILWSAQKPPVHRYRYPQCVRLSMSHLGQC